MSMFPHRTTPSKSASAGENNLALLTEAEVDTRIDQGMAEKIRLEAIWERLSDENVAGIEGPTARIETVEAQIAAVGIMLSRLYAAKPRARQRDAERREARIRELKGQALAVLADLDVKVATAAERLRTGTGDVVEVYTLYRQAFSLSHVLYDLFGGSAYCRGWRPPVPEDLSLRECAVARSVHVETPGAAILAELRQLLKGK
jgi:hypothetical protein